MIKDLFVDIFSKYSSIGERLTAIFLLLLFTVLVGLIIWLASIFINELEVKPTKTTTVTVTETVIVPPHMVPTTHYIGKTMVITYVYMPRSYEIKFVIDNQKLSLEVNYSFFTGIKSGDIVIVHYGKGRLNGKIVQVSVEKK